MVKRADMATGDEGDVRLRGGKVDGGPCEKDAGVVREIIRYLPVVRRGLLDRLGGTGGRVGGWNLDRWSLG